MSGKNNKKIKRKPMTLNEFHNTVNEEAGGDQSNKAPAQVVVHRNWAEVMDEHDEGSDQVPAFVVVDRSMLPTAPALILGPDIDMDTVPKEKPFRANISNISFDADESHIKSFFNGSKTESINLVKTDRGSGHRGFGYVDFEDRQSLINALCKTDTNLLNRTLRVQLKDSNNDRIGGNRGGDDGQRRSDLDNDWRKREPNNNNENQESQTYDSNDYNKQFYQHDQRTGSGSGGYQRGNYNNYNRNRDRNSGGDSGRNYQDRNNQQTNEWTDSNRRNNRQRQSYQPQPISDDQYGGNRQNRDRDGYKGRQSYQPRPQQHHDYVKIDSSDQAPDQQNVPPQDQQQQPPQPELPKERPKLNLQPRTKPIETQEVNEKAQATIFGGAKPVDTAARERAIEEKLKSEVSKPQPATSTSEIKDDKSVHNDDNTDAKSTTTSIDQQNQQHKSYHSDRSEHSGSDHKSQRNDQKFYSARGNKSRNHHQDHQNYETSDPSSPPQQQYYNDRNQQRSNYQQQQPRRQNDNNRQSANRSVNEERKYHQKETIQAPPPSVNAWSNKPAITLFETTQKQEEVVQQQQQPPTPPQQQQQVNNSNIIDNSRINSSSSYKNSNRNPANRTYSNSNNTNSRPVNKENRVGGGQNRRYNDNNNNSENYSNKKQYNNKKGDSMRRVGGDDRQSNLHKQFAPQQQEAKIDDNNFSNKFSQLEVEDGLEDE